MVSRERDPNKHPPPVGRSRPLEPISEPSNKRGRRRDQAGCRERREARGKTGKRPGRGAGPDKRCTCHFMHWPLHATQCHTVPSSLYEYYSYVQLTLQLGAGIIAS